MLTGVGGFRRHAAPGGWHRVWWVYAEPTTAFKFCSVVSLVSVKSFLRTGAENGEAVRDPGVQLRGGGRFCKPPRPENNERLRAPLQVSLCHFNSFRSLLLVATARLLL